MEELFFDSSNLDVGKYDAKNQRLYITFVRSGETYMYTKVPVSVKEALMDSESQGKFFAANIQKRYNFKKI